MTEQTTFTQTRWSLVELFPGPDSPEIDASFKEIDAQVGAFEGYRNQLSADVEPDQFMSIIRDLEEINLKAHTLYGYAGLWFTEDTQNQAAQTLMMRIQQFLTEMENRTLFFSLWWKELHEEHAQRLMVGSGDYEYWLEEMRHFKEHTLSEPEEKIVNLKNVTGSNALTTLYDSITNRYSYKLNVDGTEKELTRGELMVYARHHDPDLRAQAYQELYRVYKNDAPILGQMYQTLVRDWRNEQVGLRKFASPISARNLGNDIPDEVVDTLLEVCQKNAPIFQNFFRLKAKWLGVDRLRRYDIYAPIVKSDKNYPYGEAATLVLRSFTEFNPRFGALAQQVFTQQHVDSEVRKGKQSGAFCWTVVPTLTPWVKLNYQGRAEDVATMAHELGHAIHSLLAAHHSLFTSHASLPLAETASTFGEMMLVDRLLEQDPDEAVRRDLLFRQVDDAYATILRQAWFALFERRAHEMVIQGASVDEISQVYLEELQAQFGDSVEVNDEFRYEWVSIPHIYHTPFYVYAYTFGQLLVLALYRQFKEEGESFKPRYEQILSAGGSVAPVKLLAQSGIDVYKPEFWQGGFDVVAGMVRSIESLGH